MASIHPPNPQDELAHLSMGLGAISDSILTLANEAIGAGQHPLGQRIGNLVPLVDALRERADAKSMSSTEV
jgi:hypothetical protein